MENQSIRTSCQLPCLRLLAEGTADSPPESLARRGKLLVRRHLSPGAERAFKNYTNRYMNRFCKATGRPAKPAEPVRPPAAARLSPGDWIRVRSLEEIDKTLNHWGQVRGCSFMPEMAQFCGTVHRVFKCMEGFVDERDLRVKKSRGIALLDGVFCEGTALFGRCDRSCLYFWREEWLEKLDETPAFPSEAHRTRPDEKVFALVRPLGEIEATLDRDRRLGGCTFLPEMAEHCGTVHRVLKTLDKFVDERDLKVMKTSGIVLLDGVRCSGKMESGGCDRSCHLMWREEWLDRAE